MFEILSEDAVSNIIQSKKEYNKKNHIIYYLSDEIYLPGEIDIGELLTVSIRIGLNIKTNNIGIYVTLQKGDFKLNISGRHYGKADPKDCNYRMKLTKKSRDNIDRYKQKLIDKYFPLKEFDEINKDDI